MNASECVLVIFFFVGPSFDGRSRYALYSPRLIYVSVLPLFFCKFRSFLNSNLYVTLNVCVQIQLKGLTMFTAVTSIPYFIFFLFTLGKLCTNGLFLCLFLCEFLIRRPIACHFSSGWQVTWWWEMKFHPNNKYTKIKTLKKDRIKR